MGDTIEQLSILLQNNAINQPVMDFMKSLINQNFDHEQFAEETAKWLEEFRKAQTDFSHQQFELQARQKIQLDQLRQEQASWESQFNELREQLIQLHAQNLKSSQDYIELMAEVHRSQNSVASQTMQRQRLAMILAFLPLLPTVATTSDLFIDFGGIDVTIPNPYLPPKDAAVRIALDLFDRLPKTEQEYIRLLTDRLKTTYNINLHPLYQARLKAYSATALSLIIILRRMLHERTKTE